MPSRKSTKLARAGALVMTFFFTTAGMYLFRVAPENLDDLEVVAATIFRIALLVLLWRIKVYPRSLELQDKYRQLAIEFFLSMFIVETLQADFWFTLVESFKSGLRKYVDLVEDTARGFNLDCGAVCEFMRSEIMKLYVVCTLAMFFFFSAMIGAGFIPAKYMTIWGMLEGLKVLIAQLKQYFSKPPEPKRRAFICPELPLSPPPSGDDSDDPCDGNGAGFRADPAYCCRSDTDDSDRDRSSDFETNLQCPCT